MSPTHRLLKRQLRRGLDVTSLEEMEPLLEELKQTTANGSAGLKALANGLEAFLAQVNSSYAQADRDLELAQRSLELSSGELTQANEKLRNEGAVLAQTIGSLRDTTNRLLAPLGRHLDEDDGLQTLTWHLDELVSDLMRTRRELGDRQFALDQHAIVSIADANGLITYANERFCEISGYPIEQLLGRNHRIVKSDAHEDGFYKKMWQTIASGNVWHGEICNQARNGTRYWVSATIVPFLGDDGKPKEYISIRTDITQQKALETRFMHGQKFLQSIMETLGEGLYVLDAEGTCTVVNRKAEEMLGWTRDEMEGCNLHDLIHFQKADGTPQSRDDCPTHCCIRDGRIYQSNDDAFTRKDGSIFPISVVASPLIEDGRVVGTVAAFQDITERKRFETEILKAKALAESANHAKSDFLATMSHEIRTPMNGIIGMTELALDSELSREQREYLSLVKSSADSLLDIINDILDFSKIEAGRVDLECIPFRINELISTSLRPLGMRAIQKGLELIYESDPNVPETLLGDPGRLRQILVNLVGNAIKFTSKGDIRIQVRLEQSEKRQVTLRFAVSDKGIGISPEKQKSIFDPFTQEDTSTTRRFGGTGLGLAICSRLVTAMGGSIGVSSVVGEGSTFHFTVRLETGEMAKTQPMVFAELAGVPVLVVDDHEANRQLLLGYLQKWGLKATEAESGEAALAAIENADATGHIFRIVLLDAMMPNMDGYEVAERIKSRRGGNSTVVVMLTSGGKRGDAERCRELGLEAYLNKPIRQEELLEAVLAAASHERNPSTPLITRHSLAEGKARPQKILLAEDNLVNQKLALTLLKRWGHEVRVACNGREALELSAAESFDIILMDVQMPVMSGLDATRKIREREKADGGRTRIVAMTANAMAGDREICMESGMDDYLTKPLKQEALSKMLAQEQAEPIARVAFTTVQTTESVFDYRAALEQADHWVIEVINEAFRKDWRQQMSDMRNALATKDRDVMLRCAHTLKGLLGNFNAQPAVTLARKLELMAIQGEFQPALPHLEELESALKQLDAALEDFCKVVP